MLGTLALLALTQVPEPTQELWPRATYDPAVPALEEVVGHGFREEITPPEGVLRYMEALARAAPERTRLVRYAESWEGRPLVALVIALVLERSDGDLLTYGDGVLHHFTAAITTAATAAPSRANPARLLRVSTRGNRVGPPGRRSTASSPAASSGRSRGRSSRARPS